MIASEIVQRLLSAWRTHPRGTYQSWFLWEDRLKNFRSIRRGIQVVVAEMEAGNFGAVYRGSSLETVVHSIAEQRQIFKGADHAFLWKPKLRIPDIYESPANQRTFARFLTSCLCCAEADGLVAAIHDLNAAKIKGLGPAVANLLYFLHPTYVPPSNTAIVRGYNALTGSSTRLGRWGDYLAMREGMLRVTEQHRGLLSNDLGSVAGFFYDLGTGIIPVPESPASEVWEADMQRVLAEAEAQAITRRDLASDSESHTAIQGLLRDLGHALGFQVHIVKGGPKSGQSAEENQASRAA